MPGKLLLETAPAAFTENETALILADDQNPEGESWRSIREKLGTLGMWIPNYADVLGRNLRFLMEH